MSIMHTLKWVCVVLVASVDKLYISASLLFWCHLTYSKSLPWREIINKKITCGKTNLTNTVMIVIDITLRNYKDNNNPRDPIWQILCSHFAWKLRCMFICGLPFEIQLIKMKRAGISFTCLTVPYCLPVSIHGPVSIGIRHTFFVFIYLS